LASDDCGVVYDAAAGFEGAGLELLTAGLDDALRLWDLRSPGKPLRVFRGHVPAGVGGTAGGKKLKAITRPRFVTAFNGSGSGGGSGSTTSSNLIAVQGEHTTKLTLYDARSGTVVSRGDLGGTATALTQVAISLDRRKSRRGGAEEEAAAAAARRRKGHGEDGGTGGGGPCLAVAFDNGGISLLVPGKN
jgi:WD40 repeat protein